MKRIGFLILIIISGSLHAQREKALAYVEKYKDLAIAEMQRTGIPASITLAQGILESQFGESDLAKNANNHFGIKCKTEWTGPKTYHDDDLKQECFRVYASAEESYKDHSNFLMTREWYAFLFKLKPTDDTGWAYGLKKAGYATEKNYPQRLLKLINEYQLQQYNLTGLGQPTAPIAEPIIKTVAPPRPRHSKKLRIINQTELEPSSQPAVTVVQDTIPEKKQLKPLNPKRKTK